MLRVALTGGIASGKSAVVGMLHQLGAYVSQSDEVARAMMRGGEPLFHSIVAAFGAEVVSSSGELDRARLARLAFQQGQLQRLNALVHPDVMAAQEVWMEQVGQQDRTAVAVVESALVLESTFHPAGSAEKKPWRTHFDRIVVVRAVHEIRLARYMQRQREVGSATDWQVAADFEQRTAAQWSDSEREQFADVVLRNDGSLADLELQVSDLYASLRAEAIARAGNALQG